MKTNYNTGITFARVGTYQLAMDNLKLAVIDLKNGSDKTLTYSMVVYPICLLQLLVGDYEAFYAYAMKAVDSGELDSQTNCILFSLARVVIESDYEPDPYDICRWLETPKIANQIADLVTLKDNTTLFLDEFSESYWREFRLKDINENLDIMRQFIQLTF